MLYSKNIMETISNATNYNFISNNVKGIPTSKKRLKLFEYLNWLGATIFTKCV